MGEVHIIKFLRVHTMARLSTQDATMLPVGAQKVAFNIFIISVLNKPRDWVNLQFDSLLDANYLYFAPAVGSSHSVVARIAIIPFGLSA
jgi:hypothetical protein